MIVILKDNSTIDVNIRNANLHDIEGLLALNKKWQRADLKDTRDGYVGAKFSNLTFKELIEKRQVSCALWGNELIGYYLLNNVSKDGIIGTHHEIVDMLKDTGKIDRELNICVGAQAVVDTYYMGSGIRQLMLDNLKQNMSDRYHCLFATIAKDNPRAFTAHTRDGWIVVGSDNNVYHVLLKL